MRNLWTFFSALLVAVLVALFLADPADPLLRAIGLALGPALQGVPAGEPITRVADALLIGALAAYLLIFLPLSILTWIAGGRQAALIRNAFGDPGSDSPAHALSVDTGTSWWPLLAPYAERLDGTPGPGPAPGDPAVKSGRTAAIDSLVAHQSGAAVFGDFPIIALGLGVIALIGQILPWLGGAAPAGAGMDAALARGFCSLVAATAAAALFGLSSRIVAAVIRRRAESLLGALEREVRAQSATRRPEPDSLAVTPLPTSSRLDRPLVEVATERLVQSSEMTESVESAIRELHATTLRPMLQDISRLLSLLGERAGHLIATVDERLRQQAEQTRQLLAATEQISRALAEAAGSGAVPGPDGSTDLRELRGVLSDERAAMASQLAGIGQQLGARIDNAVEAAAQALARPLEAQAEAVRQMVERLQAVAAAMAETGNELVQSNRSIRQELERLTSAQQPAASDNGAAATELAALARLAREGVESLSAMSRELKQQATGRAAGRRNGMASEPTAADASQSDQGSWSQRVGALHRAAVELTSGLPKLGDGSVPASGRDNEANA